MLKSYFVAIEKYRKTNGKGKQIYHRAWHLMTMIHEWDETHKWYGDACDYWKYAKWFKNSVQLNLKKPYQATSIFFSFVYIFYHLICGVNKVNNDVLT